MMVSSNNPMLSTIEPEFIEWQQNQPVVLTCIEKWNETPDTVSIKLAHPQMTIAYSFKPGQFISLGIKITGKIEYRAYSLSSIPDETHLQLTIKRVENGVVSNYIIDQLQIGELVMALQPAGEFNCVDHPPRETNSEKQKVLLISAGCGVTPVYSMARHWLAQNANIDIDFLHIAKDATRTIYFDQLQTLNAKHNHFTLTLLLKDASGTHYPQGRLDPQWLSQLVPDIHERSVYLCGPAQFMRDVETHLQTLAFDMAHFHQESFTPVKPISSTSPTIDAHSGRVQICVPAFDRTFEAEYGTVLANALENAGLPLIVACRSGICGSCKCKVTKGSVTSTSSDTLTEDEIAQGYVLACSSTIQSDVNVQLS